ncbi:MAG: hypothetical protein JRN20_00230 [Nitrososphaerota archaeon]|nr:hypothetical protein [Nitrososphaerota archaeon]MDG6922451.1 hypothetical protein [Nitrososphaerota archaeon]
MSKDNLFSNPDVVVSLLVPNIQNESVAYKYLKEQCRGFATKSTNPAEFVELVSAELGHETSMARRQALSDLKQRAMQIFALDE